MRLLAIVFAAVLATGAPVRAQEQAGKAPLIVGVWKLNVDTSGMRLPADYMEIREYRVRPDGYLIGLLIQGRVSGPYHYLQFAARSDGKPYPEYSDTIVSDLVAAGTPTPRAYSETIDDEYTTDWTDWMNGRIVGHGKKTVSKDGRTLTITVDGSPQIRVYDKQ